MAPDLHFGPPRGWLRLEALEAPEPREPRGLDLEDLGEASAPPFAAGSPAGSAGAEVAPPSAAASSEAEAPKLSSPSEDP